MRSRDGAIGNMDVLTATRGSLDDERIAVAQALADVATVGVLNASTSRRSELLAIQLQAILNSRAIIEQPKGIMAGSGGITVNAASVLLRSYARTRGRKLTDLAQAVIRNDLTVTDLMSDV